MSHMTLMRCSGNLPLEGLQWKQLCKRAEVVVVAVVAAEAFSRQMIMANGTGCKDLLGDKEKLALGREALIQGALVGFKLLLKSSEDKSTQGR